MEWSRESVCRLIDLYGEKQILWDQNQPEYQKCYARVPNTSDDTPMSSARILLLLL